MFVDFPGTGSTGLMDESWSIRETFALSGTGTKVELNLVLIVKKFYIECIDFAAYVYCRSTP